ncbi:MAG: acyltransferase [Ignavibacteria bacterium]
MKLLRRLLAVFFFRLDQLYDFYWLPLLGILWRWEMAARGVRVGRGVLYGRPVVKLHPESTVEIGDGFNFVSANRRCSSGSLYAPCRIQAHGPTSRILIGSSVGMNGTSIVSRSATISIGPGTMIAPNVAIMDSPMHRIWPPEERMDYSGNEADKDVKIGMNVWIGTGCLLLPGAEIGDGSVVGARSVVTGSFPKNCLVAGVPARIIRYLDQPE